MYIKTICQTVLLRLFDEFWQTIIRNTGTSKYISSAHGGQRLNTTARRIRVCVKSVCDWSAAAMKWGSGPVCWEYFNFLSGWGKRGEIVWEGDSLLLYWCILGTYVNGSGSILNKLMQWLSYIHLYFAD